MGFLAIYQGSEEGSYTRSDLAFPEDYTPYTGCIATDVGQDGILDLFVGTREGDVVLLRQDGDLNFQVDTASVQLPEDANYMPPNVIVHMDIDQDGRQDLVIGTDAQRAGCPGVLSDPGGGADVQHKAPMLIKAQTHCLLSHPDGTYSSAPEGICPQETKEGAVGPMWSAMAADLNDDTYMDVILGRGSAHNPVLLGSEKDGLRDISTESGMMLYSHTMGFGLADFNGNGRRDLYISDLGPDQLWFSSGCARYEDVSMPSQVALLTDRTVTWAVGAADYDLDGDMDVMVLTTETVPEGGFSIPGYCQYSPDAYETQAHYLLYNDGQGQFELELVDFQEPLEDRTEFPSLGRADLDGDGDVDLVITENGKLRIYWNRLDTDGHWLTVTPVDANNNPVVGARVAIRQDDEYVRWQDIIGTYGLDGHSPLQAHFGLGDDDRPVEIFVAWPDGEVTSHSNEKVNQALILQR